MAYDLKGEDGELDRGKVRAELTRIIDHDFKPDEDELMNLTDAIAELAYDEGFEDGKRRMESWR